MNLEQWAKQIVALRDDTERLQDVEVQLPGMIAELERYERELLAYEGQLQNHLTHAKADLDFNRAQIECLSAMLDGAMAGRRLLDYWYRVADPSVLRMRTEARELMIVLGTLIAAHKIREAMGAQNWAGAPSVHEWTFAKTLVGLKHAYRLLSEGCPAQMVRDFLVRLRTDPNAAPPIPLRRDLKEAVSTKELGFASEEAASEFFGLAAAGLNFNC